MGEFLVLDNAEGTETVRSEEYVMVLAEEFADLLNQEAEESEPQLHVRNIEEATEVLQMVNIYVYKKN